MYSIDHIETFILKVRQEILRIFLAITILLKIILLQINVIDAYLKSFFSKKDQPIYIKILQRYENG